MDYAYCREVLEEDSDEGGHPNIDRNTFKMWKQKRKEEIRQQLRQRLLSIKGKSECSSEAQTIGNLLREKITSERTYTKVSSASNVFEIAAIETESPHLLKIMETICTTDSVMDYIAAIKHALSSGSSEDMAEEIEKYLLLGIKHNMQEKYYAASLRMAQCTMALEYVKIESAPITSQMLEGICQEGAAYFQRILEHYAPSEKG